jgi:hypothetical protein
MKGMGFGGVREDFELEEMTKPIPRCVALIGNSPFGLDQSRFNTEEGDEG